MSTGKIFSNALKTFELKKSIGTERAKPPKGGDAKPPV
jgi:hypothetical protein